MASSTAQNVSKLQSIQNKASRIIYGKNYSHELDKHILPAKLYLEYTDLLYFHMCQNALIDRNVTNNIRIGR
jgi:hypothetical protein